MLQPDEVDASKIFTENHPFIQHLNMALFDDRRM